MIKKFKSIENLAVFQNFEWDREVKTAQGLSLNLASINIVYGRNYSGKTTLSRILRAFEKGEISDKFTNPQFNLLFDDGSILSQDNLNTHNHRIRVFNEDFCRDNLKFITNPDESIDSFAILGDLNNDIENQIEQLKEEIGKDDSENSTGLYADFKLKSDFFNTAKSNYTAAHGRLESQLNNKATGRDIGIKYKSEKFGDQNYNKTKLDRDIVIVTDNAYSKISESDAESLENLLAETVNQAIPSIPVLNLSFSELAEQCKELVTKKIGQSDKIEELVKDAILNKWVKDGKKIHEGHNKCSFCENTISIDRWEQLEKHFDEESEKFEESLGRLLETIDSEMSVVENFAIPPRENFYLKFHNRYNRLQFCYNQIISKYKTQLAQLRSQVSARKENPLTVQNFIEVHDYSRRILFIILILDDLRRTSNGYTSSLNSEKAAAKEKLRLKEVSDFLTTISYAKVKIDIASLLSEANRARAAKDSVKELITTKKAEITRLEGELKDESKGAEKVNEYLNNFFGHNFLYLHAIEIEDNETKRFKFEVMRNGEKAYHLSEGEASLLSFCYFMAKLDDIETRGEKPIIWIDDPISSLDGNHIFFVYGLLKAELIDKHKFGQLFISTHNLDFLKYLKRLGGKDENDRNYSKLYLIVQRNDNTSTISAMPKYLQEYVTEFNYLFNQIYRCAQINAIDDTNYTTFYNFGNNARKFLEIYLYYKYPDGLEDRTNQKLQKFFGDEQIPAILTDRLNNEYSHLAGVFERGSTPIEVPEMKSAADAIVRRIKDSDEEQYNSLLISIGVPEVENV